MPFHQIPTAGLDHVSMTSMTRGRSTLLVAVLVASLNRLGVKNHRVELRKVDPLRCFFEAKRAKEAEIEDTQPGLTWVGYKDLRVGCWV